MSICTQVTENSKCIPNILLLFLLFPYRRKPKGTIVLGSVCLSVSHIKILSCPDFFFDVFYYIDLIFEIQLLRKKKKLY